MSQPLIPVIRPLEKRSSQLQSGYHGAIKGAPNQHAWALRGPAGRGPCDDRADRSVVAVS